MVLVAMPFPVAKPVEEEAVTSMHNHYRRQHNGCDFDRGDATKQAGDQSQAPEKFGRNGQEG